MERSTDIARIKSTLLSSGKVRFDKERLETMIRAGQAADNLLILVADVDGFVQAVAASPAFGDMQVVISDVGFETSESPEPDLIIIFRDELPGPLVRMKLNWAQLSELVSWQSVEQVEEITKYSLLGPDIS